VRRDRHGELSWERDLLEAKLDAYPHGKDGDGVAARIRRDEFGVVVDQCEPHPGSHPGPPSRRPPSRPEATGWVATGEGDSARRSIASN